MPISSLTCWMPYGIDLRVSMRLSTGKQASIVFLRLGIVDLIGLFSRQKISPNTCSCSLMLSYSSKWAGLVSPSLIPVAGQSKWMCHVLCGIKGKVVHSSFRSCCFVQFHFFFDCQCFSIFVFSVLMFHLVSVHWVMVNPLDWYVLVHHN